MNAEFGSQLNSPSFKTCSSFHAHTSSIRRGINIAVQVAFLLGATSILAFAEKHRFSFPVSVGGGADGEYGVVELQLNEVPDWVVVSPDSIRGPVSLPTGITINLRLLFELGSGFHSSSGTATMDLSIVGSIPGSPSLERRWLISSEDGFSTFSATCTDEHGSSCGNRLASDRMPPETSPLIEGPQVWMEDSVIYVSPRSSISVIAHDPEMQGAKVSRVSLTGMSLGPFVSDFSQLVISSGPTTAEEGWHWLSFASFDYAGNEEPLRRFKIASDETPPSTRFRVDGTSEVLANGGLYFEPSTPIVLVSSDPVVNGVGIQHSSTVILLGRTPADCGFSPTAIPQQASTAPMGTCLNPIAPSSFTLSIGTYTLNFFSVDFVGNAGPMVSKFVHVGLVPDGTPPVVEINLGTPSHSGAQGVVWATPTTPIRVELSDVNLPHFATSGPDSVFLSQNPENPEYILSRGLKDNTTPQFEVRNEPFFLRDGQHLLIFGGRDLAGNYSGLSSSTVRIDGFPPVTRFEIQGPNTTSGPDPVLSPESMVHLLPEDPEPNGVRVGPDKTYFLKNDTPTYCEQSGIEFSSAAERGTCANPNFEEPFNLDPGTHTVWFRSNDLLGNMETWKSTFVVVDATPPQTDLLVEASSTTDAEGRIWVTGATSATLSFTDYGPAGYDAGIWFTFFLLNRTAEECNFIPGQMPDIHPEEDPGTCLNPTYGGRFELLAGANTLAYFSVDGVGNWEPLHIDTVIVTGAQLAEYISEFNEGGAGGPLDTPGSIAMSPLGNYLYVSDSGNNRVLKYSRDGRYLGEFGKPGSQPGQFLAGPGAIAVGPHENPVVSDPGNHRIQIFDAEGNFLHSIDGITADAIVVIPDTGDILTLETAAKEVRRYPLSGGVGQTLVPGGALSDPIDMVLHEGTIYVLDRETGKDRVKLFNETGPLGTWDSDYSGASSIYVNGRDRVYLSTSGAIWAFDSDGWYLGDIGTVGGGNGQFNGAPKMASDAAGRLFVSDPGNSRVQTLRRTSDDSSGPSSLGTLEATAASPFSARLRFYATGEDGSQGRSSLYELRASKTGPVDSDIAFDFAEPLFVPRVPGPAGTHEDIIAGGLSPDTTYYLAVRALDRAGNPSPISNATVWTTDRIPVGTLAQVAGMGADLGRWGETGPAVLSRVKNPSAITLDPAGNIILATHGGTQDLNQDRIRKIDPVTGAISPVAGSFLTGPFSEPDASKATLTGPSGVALDSQARLLLSNQDPAGLLRLQDGNLAQVPGATLSGPQQLGASPDGSAVLVPDAENHRVYLFDTNSGGFSQVAGSGLADGEEGNGGDPLDATLEQPVAAVFAQNGSYEFFIADESDNRVRHVGPQGDVIDTLVGTGDAPGQAYEDVPAIGSAIGGPSGLAVDPLGAVYISESIGNRIRKVDPRGIIQTVAGSGSQGDDGAGGPALQAQLDSPRGLALDSTRGVLYIADQKNNRVMALGVDPFFTVATLGDILPATPELTVTSTRTANIVTISTTSDPGLGYVGLARDERRWVISHVLEVQAEGEEPQSRLTFVSDASNVDFETLAIFEFRDGAWSSGTVVGQFPKQLDGGFVSVTGIALKPGVFSVQGEPLDVLPPRTTLANGDPSYGDDPVFVTTDTYFVMTSTDDAITIGDMRGVGVERIEYSIDGGSTGTYLSSFTLLTAGEGLHDIQFNAVDYNGTWEDLKVSSVAVDTTETNTTPQIQGPWVVTDTGLYINAVSTLSLTGADVESAGVASGFAQMTIQTDGAEPTVSESSETVVSLSLGTHTLSYYSQDNVGNVEVSTTVPIGVDGYPPIVDFTSPQQDDKFVGGRDQIEIKFTVADNFDTAPSSTAYLVRMEDRGEPGGENPAAYIVAVDQVLDPAAIDDGLWQLMVSATDFVQNATLVAGPTFEVVHDTMPPRTRLLAESPSIPGDPIYVSSVTKLYFTAKDDLVQYGDEAGLGTAVTYFEVDPGSSPAFIEATSSFSLTGEDTHTIAYYSIDKLGNEEEVKVSLVAVDETPPSLAFTFPEPEGYLNIGNPSLRVSFEDSGVGVDPASLAVRVDGQPLAPDIVINGDSAEIQVGPLLAPGTYTATVTIADRLGNSTSTALAFGVDLVRPDTQITVPTEGAILTSKRPSFSGSATDIDSGLDISSVHMGLTGKDVVLSVSHNGGGGDIGSWTVTGALENPAHGHRAARWGNFVYVTGGNENLPTGYSQKVYIGDLDAAEQGYNWRLGEPLPQRRAFHQTVAHSGKLFVMCGYDSVINQTHNTVFVANIQEDGSLSEFWTNPEQDGPFFPSGTTGLSSAVIGDYIYLLGGHTASGRYQNQLFYAKVDPDSETGLWEHGWLEGTTLEFAQTEMAAVNINNTLYVYVTGGSSPSDPDSGRSVWYATQEAEGKLGSWHDAPSLPGAAFKHIALSAGNQIYVIGGQVTDNVYISGVNPDGTLTGWTHEDRYDLPHTLYDSTGFVYDNKLWLLGGAANGQLSDIILTADVSPGEAPTEATVSGVPATDIDEGTNYLTFAASDFAGNRSTSTVTFTVDSVKPELSISIAGIPAAEDMYISALRPQFAITATDAGGTGIDSASFDISMDGEDWRDRCAGSSPILCTPQDDMAQDKHSASISIQDIAGNVAVRHIEFEIDASTPMVAISTPTDGSFLNHPDIELQASYADDGTGLDPENIRILLGRSGEDLSSVDAAVVTSGAGGERGALGPWANSGTMERAVHGHSAVRWNNIVYITGGNENLPTGYNRTVWIGDLNADEGQNYNWRLSPEELPGRRSFHRAVAHSGKLFVMCGYDSTLNETYNTVFVADILNDQGDLSPFRTNPANDGPFFPNGTTGLSSAVIGDYIYLLGGHTSNGRYQSQLFYAKVDPDPDSTTGLWSQGWLEGEGLPYAETEMAAVNINDTLYVYVTGGSAPSDPDSGTSVWYATQGPDGELSGWQDAPSLPQVAFKHLALSAESHIYVVGGQVTNNVYMSEVGPGGQLLGWTQSDDLPTTLYTTSGFFYNQKLWLFGGVANSQLSDVILTAEVASGRVGTADASYSTTVVEGLYQAKAEGQDLAGNLGAAVSNFGVDWSPPESGLAVTGGSRTYAGRLYARGDSPVNVDATDNLAGVAETHISTDGVGFDATASFPDLDDGDYDFFYYSVDAAGNTEDVRLSSVTIDGVPPGAPSDLLAVLPTTHSISLTWSAPGDDGLNGDILQAQILVHYSSLGAVPSTGTAQFTREELGLTPGTPLLATIEDLSPGTPYEFTMWTRDTAGNYSAPVSLSTASLSIAESVDNVMSVVSSEPGLAVSSAATSEFQGALSVSTGQGLALLTNAFYEITYPQEEVSFSTPAVLRFVIDPIEGINFDQLAIFKFLDGAWTSEVIFNQQRALLADGRIELTGEIYSASLFGVFEILDSLPPRTYVNVGSPSFEGGKTYVTEMTPFTFTSFDDRTESGDGEGLGVAKTEARIDGGEYSGIGSTLTLAGLPQGLHSVEYFSTDVLGHIEDPAKEKLAVLDISSPIVSVAVSSPVFEAYVSSLTSIHLSAEDPAAGEEPGSQLAELLYLVGQGDLAQDVPGFGLGRVDGSYGLRYKASDNLGNTGPEGLRTFLLDVSTPSSSHSVGEPTFTGAEGHVYITPATEVSFSGADPEVGGVRSGLKRVEVDAGEGFAKNTEALQFPEGVHQVAHRAVDKVDNYGEPTALELRSDETATETSIFWAGGVHASSSTKDTFYASLETKYHLHAEDPVKNGVAAGVASSEYRDNEGDIVAFPEELALLEGSHKVEYRSLDNVGHTEVWHSTTVLVDATAPDSLLAIGEPSYFPSEGPGYVAAATKLTLTGNESGPIQSGVELSRYKIDDGEFVSGNPPEPFSLTGDDGPRDIHYQSQDRVGNLGDLDKKTLILDTALPALSKTYSRVPVVREPKNEEWFPDDFQIVWAAEDAGAGVASVDPATTVDTEGKALSFTGHAVDRVGNAAELVASVNLDKTAPEVDAGEDFEIIEGSTASFSGSVTDNLDEEPVFAWAFEDGSLSGQELEPKRQYPQNGSFTIVLVSTDHAGHRSEDSVVVTVKNAAPSVSAGEDQDIVEGAVVEVSAAFTDAGILDTHSATVDWGDGSSSSMTVTEAGGSGTAAASHRYFDDGTYAAKVTVTDQDGGEGSDSLSVTVRNAAPVLGAVGDKTGDEGTAVVVSVAFTDLGISDTHSASINWGDGAVSTMEVDEADGAGTVAASHVYADNGDYAAALQVTDDDEGADSATFKVSVQNVAPALAALPAQNALEGSFISLASATFTDPGFDSSHAHTSEDFTATIDWGDGTAEPAADIHLSKTPGAPGTPTSGSVQASHAFADNGTYTVKLTVEDDDGGKASTSFQVSVANATPTTAISTTSAVAAADGEAWLGGTVQVKTVQAYVWPDIGTLVSLPIGAEEPQVFVPATFTDPGFDNPAGGTSEDFTAKVEWGDGATTENADLSLVEAPGSEGVLTRGSVSQAKHEYGASGIFEMKVTVTDDDGGSHSSTMLVHVDRKKPETTVSYLGPFVLGTNAPEGVPETADVFLGPGGRVALAATDPEESGVASGIQHIFWREGNSGNFVKYGGAFLVTGEGVHSIEYYSVDFRGNEEEHKYLSVAVDETGAVASLTLGEPKLGLFGLDLISLETPITIVAQDFPKAGVAAGPGPIHYQVGSQSPVAYTEPFKLPDGTHVVQYWAEDLLGNRGPTGSRTVVVSGFQAAAITAVEGLDGSGDAAVTGDVLSNGDVSLTGSVRIDGSVTAEKVTLKGKAEVTGTVSEGGAGVSAQPIDLVLVGQLAAAASSNALIPDGFLVGDDLIVDGGRTLTLSTGVYVVDSIKLNGGGSIETNGPVDILVHGEIRINGGGKLNPSGEASGFGVFMDGDGPLHLSGGAQVVGLFYAPAAELDIAGNAAVGGHVFARTAKLSGTSNVFVSGETLPEVLVASADQEDDSSGKGKRGGKKTSGLALGGVGTADPSFLLRDIYVFPNPAVRGQAPTVHAAVGIADQVRVKIYNVAGQQVHEAALDGTPPVIDDGSGSKYAYEYTWRGHIPSGVYLYTVEAKKSGHAPIRKAGKMGVVR